jgi:ribose 5-phosphate isomerase B
MKIAIGTDHRGFAHKEYIKTQCTEYQWTDVGAYNAQRSDYPLYAQQVAELMLSGVVDYGVLLCSTGIGMAIAANRYPSIYAAVVWNEDVARQAKAEDNMNVLVLPSDCVFLEQSVAIIKAWLATSFKGGRYAERLGMIDKQ